LLKKAQSNHKGTKTLGSSKSRFSFFNVKRKSLEAAGIQAIITAVKGVEDAAAAYLAGDIIDHTELLH